MDEKTVKEIKKTDGDGLNTLRKRSKRIANIFEYSTLDAEINSSIDSIKNPTSGIVKAQSVKEVIMEADKVDPDKTIIEVKDCE